MSEDQARGRGHKMVRKPIGKKQKLLTKRFDQHARSSVEDEIRGNLIALGQGCQDVDGPAEGGRQLRTLQSLRL